MAKPQTLELCRLHLFDDIDKLKENNISQQGIDRILRLRAAFVMWNNYPTKKDAEVRDYIMSISNVEKTAAYEDIQILKILIGEYQETSKEFHRFRFNAMINNAYDLAERKHDAKAMAIAGGYYAKYNQLDKENAVKIPWDEIIPQRFEPTSDPTQIGIKPVPNIKEKISKMKKKYMNDIAEDIDFEEVDYEESKYFDTDNEKDIL